ncbi:MAG: elongation factor 1-beta [Candidatus Bathyarchaeia archaeon]
MVLQDHNMIDGGASVGSVIVSYKIFPTDITVNFEDLKKKIEACLPEFASIYGYGEEPVAFGLNALIAHIKFPEDKTGVLDELEKKFEGISEISQVQTVMVRRISR